MLITDVADVLRAAGLKVIEMPGWRDRYETDGSFDPIGILLHHDAMGLGWNSDPNDDMNVPSYMAQNGNNGSQLWVRRDGAWVAMSSGRKWHAGSGQGWGDVAPNSGNTQMVGVETDHTVGDPWPDAQVTSINRGCAAIAAHYGWQARNCCGHREYAPDRKIDPESFDLNAWRSYIAAPHSAPTGQPTDVPTPPKDWFAMATPDDLRAVVADEVRKAVGTLPAAVASAVQANAARPVLLLKVGGGLGEFNGDHFNPLWKPFYNSAQYAQRVQEWQAKKVGVLVWPVHFANAAEVAAAGFGTLAK